MVHFEKPVDLGSWYRAAIHAEHILRVIITSNYVKKENNLIDLKFFVSVPQSQFGWMGGLEFGT